MINDFTTQGPTRSIRRKEHVLRNVDSAWSSRQTVCRKALYVLSLIICLSPVSLHAQVGGSTPLIKYAQRESRKVLDYKSDTFFSDRHYELWSFSDALEFLKKNRGIDAGMILPIRITTWSIPVTLVRLGSDDFGNTRIVPTLSMGIGYFWISATSVIDEKSESIRIDPTSAIGMTTSFGLVNRIDGTAGIEPSFTLAGVIGFRSMAMSFGYDLLTKSPVLGVGFRIDVFGLSRNSYRISSLSDL